MGIEYYYSSRLLKTIADNYEHIYEGIPFWAYEVTNPWSIAEYKADFDIALSNIGKGRWRGTNGYQLVDYPGFGILQKMVIARIIGIDDYELERMGYERPWRLRGLAFREMADILNGGYARWKRNQA